MPNLIGLTAVEAKKEIKKLGLEADIKNNTGEEIDIQNAVITDQLPKQGIRINARNKSNTVYRLTSMCFLDLLYNGVTHCRGAYLRPTLRVATEGYKKHLIKPYTK